MVTLLISDLHLSAESPAIVERFLRFARGPAAEADRLYILGDLFDAWIGDDALDPNDGDAFARAVTAALDAVRRGGTQISFLHGNRDFLVGPGFAAACGASLIEDPTQVTLANRPTLLMHGDTLCTDDVSYQAFRRQVRTREWKNAFLSRPLRERRAEIAALRAKSEQVKESNPMDIMDVNSDAVSDTFRRHDVDVMVHGHTHRPARHDIEVDRRARVRWVLPAWSDAGGGGLRDDGRALDYFVC